MYVCDEKIKIIIIIISVFLPVLSRLYVDVWEFIQVIRLFFAIISS
jgi:hypothetical protein